MLSSKVTHLIRLLLCKYLSGYSGNHKLINESRWLTPAATKRGQLSETSERERLGQRRKEEGPSEGNLVEYV